MCISRPPTREAMRPSLLPMASMQQHNHDWGPHKRTTPHTVLWGGSVPQPVLSMSEVDDLESELHRLSLSPWARHWCRVRQGSKPLSRELGKESYESVSSSGFDGSYYHNRRPSDLNGTVHIPIRIVSPSESATPPPVPKTCQQHSNSTVVSQAEEPERQWRQLYTPAFSQTTETRESRAVPSGRKSWTVQPLPCAQTQFQDGQYACTAIAAAYAVYWLQRRETGIDPAVLLRLLVEDSRTVMQSGVTWYRQWRDTAPAANKGFASLAGLYESRCEASHHLHIAEEEAVGGDIHTQDLDRAANLLGKRGEGAWVFVTSHGLTVSVLVSNGRFIIVDSHPRDVNGFRPQEACGNSGRPGCVVVCEDRGQFVEFMRRFYKEDEGVLFECIPVYLKWVQE